MSRDLQEMGRVKGAVNSNLAKPGELGKSDHISFDSGQGGSYEDLGGPTPENYKPRR